MKLSIKSNPQNHRINRDLLNTVCSLQGETRRGETRRRNGIEIKSRSEVWISRLIESYQWGQKGSIRSYLLNHRVMDRAPISFQLLFKQRSVNPPFYGDNLRAEGDTRLTSRLCLHRENSVATHTYTESLPSVLFLLLSSCHAYINPQRSMRRGPAMWRNVLFTSRISIQSCGKRTRARNVGKKCLGVSLAHPELRSYYWLNLALLRPHSAASQP